MEKDMHGDAGRANEMKYSERARCKKYANKETL